MAKWNQQRALAAYLILVCATLAGPGRAQPGCVNDVPLIIRNEKAGVVELKEASIRNITDSNQRDREVNLRTGRPSTGTRRGQLVADLDAGNAAPDNVRQGFQRQSNQFWEANYPRGLYVFDQRQDLDIETTMTIQGNKATALGESSGSEVTLNAVTRDIRTTWWGGTNSLRRLRGRVRFDYSDLSSLSEPGTHRATVNICVTVKNYL